MATFLRNGWQLSPEYAVVNSIILLAGGQWSFIIGLGVTQFVDQIDIEVASQFGATGNAMAISSSLFFAGIFSLFGVFAKKGNNWAFIVGMILYAMDGLLFIFAKDYLGIGFHIYVLYCLYSGLKANNILISGKTTAKERENTTPTNETDIWVCPSCDHKNPNDTYTCQNCKYALL